MRNDRAGVSPRQLLALFVAGVAVLVAGAWIPAWSRDEAATAMVIRRPLDQVLRTFSHDPALEPYYLLLHVWSSVSSSELWLRLPSVLAAAATAVVLVQVAERFVAPPAALLAGVLVLILPATTRYGQDARPYAMTMLVATLVVLCWLQDRALRGWRAPLRLVALLVLLGLLHAYALLLVGALAVVAFSRPVADRRREVLAVFGVGLAAVLLLSPFLWVVAGGGQGQPHPPAVGPLTLAEEALRLPAGVLAPVGAPVLAVLVLALVLVGWVLGWRRGGVERTGVVLSAAWLILPPASLCLLQLGTGAPGLVTRYWMFCLPAIALASAPALAAAQRARRALAVVVLAVVAGAGLPTQIALRSPDGHAGQGWRQLPNLLTDGELADMAILVEGPHVRALLANHPVLAERMPLVRPPGPSGRILPRIESVDSTSFRAMAVQYDRVVVLQTLPRPSHAVPTAQTFVDFRRELLWYDNPAVLCRYFGYPLGVFTTSRARLSTEETRRLTDALLAVDPAEVACAGR